MGYVLPLKTVICQDCGIEHQSTRMGARCTACKRNLSSRMTLERRRLSMTLTCKCGCGTPSNTGRYFKGHGPRQTEPCPCGCGRLTFAGRRIRGHRREAIAQQPCACGCGQPVSDLQNKFRWGHFAYPCIDCGVEVRSANGVARRCRPCAKAAEKIRLASPESKERLRRWNKANALRMRVADHGLTIEQFQAMYEAQGGRCAICRRPEGITRHTRLAIDHWHGHGCETTVGKHTRHCGECVRGLLCGRCNTGIIGQANDDPQLLRRAIAYLERTSQLKLVA